MRWLRRWSACARFSLSLSLETTSLETTSLETTSLETTPLSLSLLSTTSRRHRPLLTTPPAQQPPPLESLLRMLLYIWSCACTSVLADVLIHISTCTPPRTHLHVHSEMDCYQAELQASTATLTPAMREICRRCSSLRGETTSRLCGCSWKRVHATRRYEVCVNYAYLCKNASVRRSCEITTIVQLCARVVAH